MTGDANLLPGMEKELLRAAALVKMPFGKHRGKSLGWIGGNEPEYLAWVLDNVRFQTAGMRESVERVHREVNRSADGV